MPVLSNSESEWIKLVNMPLIGPAPVPVEIRPGMVIAHSCVVKPLEYRLASPESSGKANDEVIPIFPSAAVTVSGNNLVVDFQGATLSGTPLSSDPDGRKGLGIRVLGKNVTIKNARVRGYRVGLLAENCVGLKLVNCDMSYNWKQRLRSTLEREDESDWQSYHHNEKGEWFRYGAGIYLQGCDRFEIKNTRVRGGQCGLLMTRSNNGRVWNSDFSFNSGLGIGMYRSSDNQIMHNHIDWDVRGFSYGVYNRGQDSAGLLVFEQCNRNTFAYNSVTHGGDGFFLWAGQSTMDSGEGGCNDNIVFANDFSHAPTNGIEATFSRNYFIGNSVLECWHGVWGGYSYDTKIIGNRFEFNAEAISIEHGQDNVISLNRFERNNTGVGIWQDPIADRTWGYPKHHESGSHSYVIRNNRFLETTHESISLRNTTDVLIDDNSFNRLPVAIALKNSSHVVTGGNSFDTVQKPVRSDNEGSGNMLDVDQDQVSSTSTGEQLPAGTIDGNGRPILEPETPLDLYLARFEDVAPASYSKIVKAIREQGSGDYDAYMVPPLKGGVIPFLSPNTLRGQRYILVNEWGPYDFQRPILWPRGASAVDPTRQRFEILGPVGKWRVVSTSGVKSLSSKTGAVPGELEAVMPTHQSGETQIELEYLGGVTVDEKGNTTQAGKPIRFHYGRFYAPIAWDINFYGWDKQSDPRTLPAAFAQKLRLAPLAHVHRDSLNYAGYGAFEKGVPATYFATVATGKLALPSGEYTLELTTDDGARLFVDGKRVIDEWHYQGPTAYSIKLKGGAHDLRVEHFQIDGYSALKLVVRKG